MWLLQRKGVRSALPPCWGGCPQSPCPLWTEGALSVTTVVPVMDLLLKEAVEVDGLGGQPSCSRHGQWGPQVVAWDPRALGVCVTHMKPSSVGVAGVTGEQGRALEEARGLCKLWCHHR